MGAPIRILIVDDHAVVREGFASYLALESDLVVVGMAATGEEALELYDELEPNIVLLDVRLFGMSGLAVLEVLQARQPPAKVLMVSSQEGDEVIHRALKAGALGYIFKSASAAEVVGAIRGAHIGETAISPDVAKRLAARDDLQSLSDREATILKHVARGQSNQNIANVLHISPHTVKNHLSNIMNKLEASDRAHAVSVALQRGIIDLD